MTLLSLQVPIIDQPNVTEDAKVASDFTAIQAWANGGIDSSNIAGGGILPGNLSAAALGNGTLIAHSSFTYGTVVSAGQVTDVSPLITFTVPAAGTVIVEGEAMVWETGSTSTVLTTFQMELSLDAAAAVGAGTRTYYASAATDYFLESSTFFLPSVAAGAHNIRLKLSVASGGFTIGSAGGIRVKYQAS